MESNNSDDVISSESQALSNKSLYRTFKKLFIRHSKQLEKYED